ncbi:TrmB family transcriptional regulator [Streptacidiphilus jiangxiensis]|uniref:Sugar-specific transcriptional regulator TrmB n=1 Tax=Streptacidiphilus jiangxiensis TaxID=235985 RepID=A0A1H7QK82_STRJI|nr:helix-turn-helix domain-containing protein [Streptacidiphilus jiangxiensis]SEL48530.1 Sugar-specific transcriptional regulator TrmB [Streptacidiphilus jiangxiensis]
MTPAASFCERALETLGLTSYSSRAYATLARLPQATAPDLADATRVPRQRIYDVLGSLIDQGLVAKTPGKPAAYRAVDPASAAEALIRGHRDSLARLEVVASDLVAELRTDWLTARSGLRPAAARSRDELGVVARMDHWREYAHHSVRATARPPFDGLADEDWVRRVRAITASGGSVRCVYHADLLSDPRLVARAESFAAAGEQARVTSAVETRMILTDSERALLTLPSADPAPDSAPGPVLLVDDAHTVARLQETFDHLWARATPFTSAA